jgi:hypothetical protein
MCSITYACPLPGFAGPRTYAAWPVWSDSAREEVRFAPRAKKEAARCSHKTKWFDCLIRIAGKHGGAAQMRQASDGRGGVP